MTPYKTDDVAAVSRASPTRCALQLKDGIEPATWVAVPLGALSSNPLAYKGFKYLRVAQLCDLSKPAEQSMERIIVTVILRPLRRLLVPVGD